MNTTDDQLNTVMQKVYDMQLEIVKLKTRLNYLPWMAIACIFSFGAFVSLLHSIIVKMYI